jgi:hypothetical protein
MSPQITAHSRRSGNVVPLCLGTALRLLGILPSPSTSTRKRAGVDPRLQWFGLGDADMPPLVLIQRIDLRIPLPCAAS